MQMVKQTKTVYIAMSGGVDSSVAAALLKKQGFNVIGVFMKPWSPYAKASAGQATLCLWKQEREDALRAAAVLDIPLLTWDFSKEYKKFVADYMIREYKAGRTPNPDVMCNKEIKFGLFFKKAMAEGADYIATGHYARVKQVKKLKVLKVYKGIRNQKLYKHYEPYKLLTAVDTNKDQTYFLWTLKQEQLAKTLFPIGDYIKPEVRKMAKKFGLSNHDKKDSQGVCFIGPLNMKDFLKNYIKPKRGKVLLIGNPSTRASTELSRMSSGRSNFKEIGSHDGVYYYTIGQRHGLNLGIGGGPYFVVAKDIKKNIIYVGKEKDLLKNTTIVRKISWIAGAPKFPVELSIRVRYRAPLKKAILRKNGELIFKQSERAITSGQSAVFYSKRNLPAGRQVLGGGIVE